MWVNSEPLNIKIWPDLEISIGLHEILTVIHLKLAWLGQFFCCSVAKSVWFFAAHGTVACRPLLYMGFSRQGYWDGLPFLPLYLPDKGFNHPALAGDSLLLSHRKAQTGSNSAFQINVYFELQVMTLFGSRDFADVISSSHTGLVGLKSNGWCYKKDNGKKARD